MFKIFKVLLIAMTTVGAVFATSTPIPESLAVGTSATSYSAVDYIDSFSFPSGNLICPSGAGGCGGGFQASINAGPTLSTPAVPTTVWCVDYQLDVSGGAAYTADITTLANIATPTDPYVRYGNLPTSSQQWINSVTDPTGIDAGETNSAAYRYTLAAALVSQYQDGSGSADPVNVNGSSAINTAIQEAIWYITYNNDYQTGATWPPFPSAAQSPCTTFSATNYSCWIQYAENNANTVNLNAWGVVSGPASAGGATGPAGTLLSPQNNSFQTFLVQVATPEPTFEALALMGVSCLGFFVVRRRIKV